MDSTETQRAHKRSPFDLIMNQLRRKKSFSERRQRPSVSRFFWSSENVEKRDIPEDTEDNLMGTGDSEVNSTVGWGRVKQFVQKMGRKVDERRLSLSHCDLTATDVVELATVLPYLPVLEEMDLSWNDLIGGSLKAVTFHLWHVNRLHVLKLSGCRLTVQDLAALGDVLEEIPLLEVLDLSWNSGIGGNVSPLAIRLRASTRLKELHLTDCGLTAADVGALGASLSSLPMLELIDLSSNQPLQGAVGGFGLRNAPALRVLRLQMCSLSCESLAVLCQAFPFIPKLHELDLSCNKSMGGGMATAAGHLSCLRHLRSLDLHLSCMTEADVVALVQALPSLRDLAVLDLSSNKKIGGVAQTLFPALPLAKIMRLDLSNCCLTAESYQALVCVMPELPLLEVLNLSWNKCVGGRLQFLLDTLSTGAALQELRLSSCALNAEDVQQLACVARRGSLSHLCVLHLSYNDDVGEQHWLPLFQDLSFLVSLCELDVSLTPSARAPALWFAALMAAVPGLRNLAVVSLQRWVITHTQRRTLDTLTRNGGRSLRFEFDSPEIQSEE